MNKRKICFYDLFSFERVTHGRDGRVTEQFLNRFVVSSHLVRTQPLLCVHDVEASSRWFQRLLNCKSDHGGPHYERLVSNGRLVLQLHHWDIEDHHGRIGDPNAKPYGNGVLLWFELDDFDAAVERARELNAQIILPRHRNPPDGNGGPNYWELWLRDPNGYTLVLASPDGSADGNWKPW